MRGAVGASTYARRVALDPRIVAIVAVAAAAVAVVALLAALLLALRLRALRRAPVTPLAALGDDPAAALAQGLHAVTGDLAALTEQVRRIGAVAHGAVQHVGLVRFDAFADMGGRQSFSVALLDGEGSGFVLTGLSGRTESRTYAKEVARGQSLHPLSPEETAAVARALGDPAADATGLGLSAVRR